VVAGGCTAQVNVRPSTPPAARFSAPAGEVVGLFASPDFIGRVAATSFGPTTVLFDLGRGGGPMVQEILQARFARVVPLGHQPPLAPGERPEVFAVLSPAWKDFSAVQLDPQGTCEVAVVLELLLQRREGSPVWTRSFSGKARGLVSPTHPAGTSPEASMAALANRALEQMGAALAEELSTPQLVASVSEVREQGEAQAAAEQRGAARQQARRLFVQPFAGKGPLAAQATILQGEVLSRLLGSARFVAVASGEQGRQVDAAIREVNREGVGEEDWVRIGQGRGAELMLGGELVSAGQTCSVKVELTDLSTRLVLASFFRSLPGCTSAALLELSAPAAQAMLDGI